MTDAQLLLHIITKCASKIPYGDIAAEFGTTPVAVRSKVNRLKRKYKDGTADITGGADNEDDTEAPVIPKKRKRAAKASRKSDREEKKVNSEEDEDDEEEVEAEVPEDEE